MGSQGSGSDRRRQDAHSPAPANLVERAQHGDEAARTELLVRLEPLVKWAVGPFGSDGVPMEDLEQAGQVGVLEALKGFDPSQGAAFHTCAVPWIQGEARAVARESGCIDLEDRGIESACACFGNIHENTVRNRHDRAVQMIVDMLNGIVPRPARQRSISWEYVVGDAPAGAVRTLDDMIWEHYLTPEFLATAEITLLRTQRGPRFLLGTAGSTITRQLLDELGDSVIGTSRATPARRKGQPQAAQDQGRNENGAPPSCPRRDTSGTPNEPARARAGRS